MLGLPLVAACGAPRGPQAPSQPRPGVAVLELFTSEGCGSCPPADELLGELMTEERVVALAFHVDYWDAQGWVDRYGAAEHGRRQERYARAMRRRGLFTPQLVVNGQRDAIGSDRARAMRLIDEARARPQVGWIDVEVVGRASGELRVAYRAGGVVRSASLLLALTEDGVKSSVGAGVNDGLVLTHHAVVRSTAQVGMGPGEIDGEATLSVPAELSADKGALVALLQDERSMAVLACSSVRGPSLSR